MWPHILIITLLTGSQPEYRSPRVKYLDNGHVVVGVLPEIGGRIVCFGTKRGGNILKSAPWLWNDTDAEKPKINEVNDYKAYHGSIIWPSPMSEWWSKQSEFPEKRNSGSRWPPDPSLIYGAYKVTAENERSLEWQSEPSPVSGIQVTQKIELQEGNRMIYRVMFRNVTDSIIQWGIWFNTRLEGRAHCFVKTKSDKYFYFKDKENLKRLIPWQWENGYFSFLPEKLKDPKEKIYSKACIDPLNNAVAAYWKGKMIVIETPDIDRRKIHPDHTFVEVYNQLTPDQKDNLLEIEFHTAYTKLNPGESVSACQIWKIYDTCGLNTYKDQITFLNQILAHED